MRLAKDELWPIFYLEDRYPDVEVEVPEDLWQKYNVALETIHEFARFVDDSLQYSGGRA
jgi:hypothetical protein